MGRVNCFCNFFYGLALKAAFRTSYSAKTMRRNFELIVGTAPAKLRKKYGLTVEVVNLDGILAEIISPKTTPSKTLFYLHGGGYFMGSIYGYRKYASMFVRNCGVRVVLIDYRLAPEHPYPAALEDAVKSYKEVLKKFPNQPIIIAGDSAGGGLTLATGLFLRDSKIALPAGFIGISPWTDLTGSGESVTTNRCKDVWLSRKHMEVWAPWYAGSQNKMNPYLSPVFGDFHGLSPILLMVGDREVLLDDSTRVSNSAKKAGVKADLHLGQSMQHDWMLAMPFLNESKRAWKAIETFISSV